MTRKIITTTLETQLTWDYQVKNETLASLYERSKEAQWNAATAVDWSVEVPYGSPLPETSHLGEASFLNSPFAARGRGAWDQFRWEFQNWMISQFLHGEQAAMIAAARMAETMPDVECKIYAASQAADEARHVEAFSRYTAHALPQPYQVSAPLETLIGDLLTDSRWDITALGMQVLIEALAMAAFRTADVMFNDPLIKQISRLVARDEARHLSFGITSLRPAYRDLTASELAERETFALDAAHLMRRRFMLEDVWDRLEVPLEAGREFAANDPMMTAYRHTIFSKIVFALMNIGLMTDRVRDGLISLDLLDPRRVAPSGR
jgi:hypothetical protein